jgi:hypothetical protein
MLFLVFNYFPRCWQPRLFIVESTSIKLEIEPVNILSKYSGKDIA